MAENVASCYGQQQMSNEVEMDSTLARLSVFFCFEIGIGVVAQPLGTHTMSIPLHEIHMVGMIHRSQTSTALGVFLEKFRPECRANR
jgi:hypothetical protein